MQELKSFKKINIQLDEFESEADVISRSLMAKLSEEDIQLLEEILYSPLEMPIQKLAESVDLSEEETKKHLKKLLPLNLFQISETKIIIQKDRRKYFETFIEKFDPDFCPGVDYLQSYMRCLPIHLFQVWYHIPRSSNNIFSSIVEKYLLTPQVYKRYLYEFTSEDTLLAKIATKVLHSKRLEIPTEEIKATFEIDDQNFQEIMIQLELSFVCVSSYKKRGAGFEEVISPLYEWSEYLRATHQSQPNSIEDTDEIEQCPEEEYPFIADMSTLLTSLFENPALVRFDQSLDSWTATREEEERLQSNLNLLHKSSLYLTRVINKLLVLGLAVIEEDALVPTRPAKDWLNYPIDKRTHVTFKHPHNTIAFMKQNAINTNERSVLEIQKSLGKLRSTGWVYFDDFLKRSIIPLNEDQQVELKKTGREWRYTLPSYTTTEASFIRQAIMEWLYESGIVRTGKHKGKDCFCVTKLGKALFTS